jgi:hypothetical protein
MSGFPEGVLQSAADGRIVLASWEREPVMAGPRSAVCPVFPEDFVVEARATVRRKTAPHQHVQRYGLVLVLHENPHLGQEEAGRQVGLSGRQVLRWRQRRAAGDFSVTDTPGRGRKAAFSPPGSGSGQGHRL